MSASSATTAPSPRRASSPQLLDGTGVNMMLLQTPGTAPAELILTQRNGGPTPPNPNASRDEERDLMTNRRFGPMRTASTTTAAARAAPAAIPAPRPFRVNPNHNQPVDPASATQSPPATTTQQSPNGVKTPQQIYQELQQMRQQQQNSTH